MDALDESVTVFDNHGEFIAAAGIVRDVTSTFKDVSIEDAEPAGVQALSIVHPLKRLAASGGLMDWILGKAAAQYQGRGQPVARKCDLPGCNRGV